MEVSVALCTYNAGSYLNGQLQSILEQTVRPDEIVVSDDGSSDKTRQHLHKWKRRFPELLTILEKSEHLGVTKNFERCIRACSGDLIMLCDQDDIWKPTKIERQVEAFETTEARLICHDSHLMTADGQLYRNATLWNTIHETHKPGNARAPKAAISELLKRNFVQGATILFDRDLCDVILPIPKFWNHDSYIAFWAAATGGIVDLDDELLYYRVHEQQDIGVEGSLWGKIKRELQYPSTHYQQLAKRWPSVIETIKTLDSEKLAVGKTWLKTKVARRMRYDRLRATVHSEDELLADRFRALLAAVTQGDYRSHGHPGLIATDVIGIILNRFEERRNRKTETRNET